MGREKPGTSGVTPAVLAAAGAVAVAVPVSAQTSSAGGKHRRARHPALEYWAVAEALASLHPDHRQVLVETYFRGSSVKEAAQTLGIPARTVKSRAFYALKALKLALQEQGLAP
jgi:DNA-directed RNA polymerase specialized sigma24 family protein